MEASLATPEVYEALTILSLPSKLAAIEKIALRVGGPSEGWTVKEVGDGNLNLVFIVSGTVGSVIIKQALPYVRLVGDSWPLPLYRATFEYHALTRQARRDPGIVPQVFYFNETMALLAMEYLTPHTILRRKLINGERVAKLGKTVGIFCARTAFRGSELSLSSSDKKAEVGLFSGNVAIPAITEALVFTDPYFNAPLNKHTPSLDPIVKELRENIVLKTRVQKMLMRFASNTETLIHGDLHSGSIMATSEDLRVIDPEFAQYGPMGFDIGMLLANYMMAYFSQVAHRSANLEAYQAWIVEVIAETLASFDEEFCRLWRTERSGMLYPKSMFEDQGHDSMPACKSLLQDIRADALAFCGIEMHRRCLSLAHNADFEDISDPMLRATLEARNIKMGEELILTCEKLTETPALLALLQGYNTKNFL
jgi:5-methylthioribose kinase